LALVRNPVYSQEFVSCLQTVRYIPEYGAAVYRREPELVIVQVQYLTGSFKQLSVRLVLIRLAQRLVTGDECKTDEARTRLLVRGGPMLDMELKVYNEWGNLVFVSTSQSVGWEGTYKGEPQPAGTYVWTLTGTTADGTPVNTHGAVTILR